MNALTEVIAAAAIVLPWVAIGFAVEWWSFRLNNTTADGAVRRIWFWPILLIVNIGEVIDEHRRDRGI